VYKEEYPPLFPIGFHDRSIDDLQPIGVDAFKTSSTRQKILDGLRIVVTRVASVGIIGEIWVDGSFVTQKIDPTDVDILLMVNGAFFDSANSEQQEAMKWV